MDHLTVLIGKAVQAEGWARRQHEDLCRKMLAVGPARLQSLWEQLEPELRQLRELDGGQLAVETYSLVPDLRSFAVSRKGVCLLQGGLWFWRTTERPAVPRITCSLSAPFLDDRTEITMTDDFEVRAELWRWIASRIGTSLARLYKAEA